MSWNGSGEEPRNEGPSLCCEKPPMLRARPNIVFESEIAYVQYECVKCGSMGGLAIVEPEARQLWDDDRSSSLTQSIPIGRLRHGQKFPINMK